MIRIFIGTSPNGEDAEANAVLEYTLRKHASQPLEIEWLKLSADRRSPCGGWRLTHWNTPFSWLRWAIPALCGFEGRAIYMDTDVLVLGDIAELWTQDMHGASILIGQPEKRPYRSCVMLMDCAALKSLPDLNALKSEKIPNDLVEPCLGKVGQFQGLWNCVDLKGSSLADPDLRAVHYSHIATQPHLAYAARRLKPRRHWYDGKRFAHRRPELQALFDKLLHEATAAGYAPARYDPGETKVHYQIRNYANVRVKGYE